MRDIKFRAWDLNEKEMRYMGDNYVGDFNGFWKWYSRYAAKLMQFTGLKDKNGKEIYEGDIIEGYTIENKYQPKQKVEATVDWDYRKACWYLKMNFRSYNHTMPLLSFLSKKEVIGNIYETNKNN